MNVQAAEKSRLLGGDLTLPGIASQPHNSIFLDGYTNSLDFFFFLGGGGTSTLLLVTKSLALCVECMKENSRSLQLLSLLGTVVRKDSLSLIMQGILGASCDPEVVRRL